LIKKVNADNINQTVTLEIDKGDLEKIIDSVKYMVNKQQQTLLENLPSSDSDRKNLDDYKALAENLRKIWEFW
jgi:Zn-finger nucleic acid-binding protein